MKQIYYETACLLLRLQVIWEKLFSKNKLARRADKLREEKPVIVMGRGKSGTRLLPKIFNRIGVMLFVRNDAATSDIDDMVFQYAIKKIAMANIGILDIRDIKKKDLDFFRLVCERLRKKIFKNHPQARFWGWKYPETYLITPYVFTTFPQACYIHMIRDGREVALKPHLTDNPGKSLGKKLISYIGARDEPRHIQAALSWAFQLESYNNFFEKHAKAWRKDFYYENFCQGPVEIFQTIARELGIELLEEHREFIRSWIRPQNHEKKKDTEKMKSAEKRIEPVLKKYGYL